jgi:hypothetical protein
VGRDLSGDRNGRFLVLPEGMKAETGRTVDNKTRNAVNWYGSRAE